MTAAEAAEVIGCSHNHVYRLARQGRLAKTREPGKWRGFNLEDVEQVSLAYVTRPSPGHPYWATVVEAADILGVSRERVRQLAVRGRVPAIRHHSYWLFRRRQLEVVGKSREARKLAREWG